MKNLRDMSVWSIAIGLELGLESQGVRACVRFVCLHCLQSEEFKGWVVHEAPYAIECMRCVHPTEPIVSVTQRLPQNS